MDKTTLIFKDFSIRSESPLSFIIKNNAELKLNKIRTKASIIIIFMDYMSYEMNKKYLAKILIICLNILLLSLGIWQIKRGQYKQHMLDLQAKVSTEAFINSQDISKIENIAENMYKHVNIKGKLLTPSFYLYRAYNGNSGYWLVNPLLIEKSNNIVLVAHEFFNYPSQNVFFNIADLQKLNHNNYDNTIELQTYILPQLPRVFNLRADNFNVNKQHLMLQNISSEDYKQHYNPDKKYNILNFTLIPLDKNLPNLKQPAMTPDKHYGYAATWLGLFFVSLCFTYGLFIKTKIKSGILTFK